MKKKYEGVRHFSVTNKMVNGTVIVQIDFSKSELQYRLPWICRRWDPDYEHLLCDYEDDVVQLFLALLAKEAIRMALDGFTLVGIKRHLANGLDGFFGFNGVEGVKLLQVQAYMSEGVEIKEIDVPTQFV